MPKEVLKTCRNKSFQINPNRYRHFKNFKEWWRPSWISRNTNPPILQTLFKLSYGAIIWQNQLIKIFLTFQPSMEIRHNDNKSNSDEKKTLANG